jgi:hypothetical protein
MCSWQSRSLAGERPQMTQRKLVAVQHFPSNAEGTLRLSLPAEAEAEYYARLHAGKHTGHT